MRTRSAVSLVALSALFAGGLAVPAAVASQTPAAPGVDRASVLSEISAARAAGRRPELTPLADGLVPLEQSVELKAGPKRGRSEVQAPDLTVPAAAGQSNAMAANATATADIQVIYGPGFTHEARAAFQAAVDITKTLITSDVPIVIDATFAPLGPRVLGSAGATYGWDFGDGVVFPAALANHLADSDLDPGPDVIARFSSTFTGWHFGSAATLPADRHDFTSVVLHEIWHGLGFAGGMYQDPEDGALKWRYGSKPMVYDLGAKNTKNERLLDFPSGSLQLEKQLVGGQLGFDGLLARRGAGGEMPRLYAPAIWEQGSSYSHLDERVYPAGNPNSLMTFEIGPGEAIRHPGPIALGMFADMGWDALMVPAAPIASVVSGARSATVRWKVPVDGSGALDDGGVPISHYEVLPSTGAPIRVPASATSVTVPGLTPGASYSFGVKAVNGIGSSPVSARAGVTIQVGDTATAIEAKYAALGGSIGFLGAPLGPEAAVRDGRFTDYRSGSIYWRSQTGAHEVHGLIRDRWRSIGGAKGPLGFPSSDELFTTGGGRLNQFEGGSVYWTASTGAQDIYGAIRATWQRLGAERSGLGFPTTGERGTPDRTGRYNHFQAGSVYWTPPTGAREVRGAIRDRWAGLGWERSALGYPVTDELPTPGNRGRFNHFQNGSVYWSLASGAQEVRGAIRNQWASLGWEGGRLGFPTSSEFDVPGGRRGNFQGGAVLWDARTGATSVLWH